MFMFTNDKSDKLMDYDKEFYLNTLSSNALSTERRSAQNAFENDPNDIIHE